jgi:hypothetical protein
MSRCNALKERKSRRESRANIRGAQASMPACFGQSVIAGNPVGRDACAPRMFALTLSAPPFGKTRQTGSLPYSFRRRQ